MTVKTAGETGQELLDAIRSKDAQLSITKVQQFRDGMRDTTVGSDFVVWITEPANLTLVHKTLAEDLSVPQRLLAIKRATMSRTQRAVLLILAMEQAIKRVHNL